MLKGIGCFCVLQWSILRFARSGPTAVGAACCVTVHQQGLIIGSGEGKGGEECFIVHATCYPQLALGQYLQVRVQHGLPVMYIKKNIIGKDF